MNNTNIPLYKEISNYITEAIKTNRYEKGMSIPTEEEFCKIFNTSRMTVRKAIDELVGKGMLTRIRGKGTFVAYFNIEKTMNSATTGWSESMKALGFKTHSKILNFEKIRANEIVSENLKLPINSEVFVLERLRYADDNPVLIEKVYVSAQKFPGLDKYSFEDESFYEIMQREYDVYVNHSYQKIKAVEITGKKAKLLSNTDRAIVIEMLTTTYDQYSRPLEFGVNYINSDIYVLRYVIKK